MPQYEDQVAAAVGAAVVAAHRHALAVDCLAVRGVDEHVVAALRERGDAAPSIQHRSSTEHAAGDPHFGRLARADGLARNLGQCRDRQAALGGLASERRECGLRVFQSVDGHAHVPVQDRGERVRASDVAGVQAEQSRGDGLLLRGGEVQEITLRFRAVGGNEGIGESVGVRCGVHGLYCRRRRGRPQ